MGTVTATAKRAVSSLPAPRRRKIRPMRAVSKVYTQRLSFSVPPLDIASSIRSGSIRRKV